MKKLTKIFITAACIAAIGTGAAALGGCGEKAETVNLTGSTSVEAIMTPLAGDYEKTRNVRINVGAGGSGAGITDTLEGRNDFGMSSRALKKEELDKGLEGKQLCLDGIVLVVSKNCAVNEISNEEIYELYINGTAIVKDGATISAAIGRTDSSGTRDAFDEAICNEAGKTLKKLKDEDKIDYNGIVSKQDGTGEVVSLIESDKNNRTVGYISMGSYLKNTDKLKALKFKAQGDRDYVEATEANIKNGSYKLQRPFVIVTKKDKSDMKQAARKFYDWLFGSEAQTIIKENGYIL